MSICKLNLTRFHVHVFVDALKCVSVREGVFVSVCVWAREGQCVGLCVLREMSFKQRAVSAARLR